MTGQAAPARRRGGRPPVLNRADIVAAAVVVVDEEGLEALTMRRLGAALGVSAMSLYRHLPNRDAVLAAVVDQLAAEAAPAPDPDGDWPGAVRAFAHGYRAVLLRHPRAVPLLATHPVTVETGLAAMAGVLGAFAAAGVDRDRALTVIRSAAVFTLGHALAQVGAPGDEPAAPEHADYSDRWYADGLEALVEGFRRTS